MDEECLKLLLELANERGRVKEATIAMFSGEKILNTTEDRSVLHRSPEQIQCSIQVDGKDVMPAVNAVKINQGFLQPCNLRVVEGLHREVHSTDVVNIGIGGSDLGPSWSRRRKPFAVGPKVALHTNIDGTHMAETLKLNPDNPLHHCQQTFPSGNHHERYHRQELVPRRPKCRA